MSCKKVTLIKIIVLLILIVCTVSWFILFNINKEKTYSANALFLKAEKLNLDVYNNVGGGKTGYLYKTC